MSYADWLKMISIIIRDVSNKSSGNDEGGK